MNPERPDTKKRLAEIALGAAWLIGLAAALQLVEMLLGKSPLAAALAGAVLADVVAGFAGVRWDTPKAGAGSKAGAGAGEASKKKAAEKEPKTEDAPASGPRPAAETKAAGSSKAASGGETTPVRDVAIGMAAALAAVLATLLFGAVLGWVRVDGGAPAGSIAFAILRSGALGVRDELMFRGIVLTAAARAGVNPLIAAIVAALAGGASLALLPSVSPGAVALAVSSGFFFALLWQRFGGAWAAVGANAFWIFLIGAVIRGSVIDVSWVSGSLTSGGRSTGGAAWLAAGVFVLLGAAALIEQRRRAARGQAAPKP